MSDNKLKGESWYVIEVECPYCEDIQQIETGGNLEDITCLSCLKEFEVEKPSL